jgi:hypothetical protein
VTVTFDSLGFISDYSAEPEPEFPGDGQWQDPVFGFDRDGTLMEPFESRWGTPLTVAFDATRTGRWVGFFAAGGLGGVTGLIACPLPTESCVLNDGLAYVVSVDNPRKGASLASNQVTQVVRVPTLPLVLLVSFCDMVALGSSGIAWRSPRLALDDLRVESVSEEAISCSRYVISGSSTIQLDPLTGKVMAGTPFDET